MTIELNMPISFNWENVEAEKYEGEYGFAIIKTQNVGNIKLRQVEYSKNYLADHWCDKGHIVFIVSGQIVIEHIDNSEIVLNIGSTYVVGDNSLKHKVKSTNGATVLIID